jgi:signal transduction histidine kinase
MRFPRLLRAAPFRLALAFAAALTGSTIAIFGYIYWQTAALETDRLHNFLELEAEEAIEAPLPLLLDQVETRLANDLHRYTYAAFFDAQGTLVAGNLGGIPTDLPIDGLAHEIAVMPLDRHAPQTLPAIIVGRRRSDGGVLIIGRDPDSVIALQSVVLNALERGMLPAVLLSLLVGALVANKAIKRVKTLHRTIGRIMNGDLLERLPITGAGDDLDSLAFEINVMLDEIVKLMEEIRSVGDNIAHDLRTPLSVMYARLERGLRESGTEALHGAIRQSLSSLDRTLSTITSLLRITEIENSRRLRFVTETDLVAIALEIHELYDPLAEAKSIDFKVVHARPAIVEADHGMMIEALSNLVDNAIKFTPPNGTVRIEVAEEAGVPLLRVTDSGFGIPAAERANVMQRFYRSDKTQHIRGSGLGLSLVAAIAKLHGFRLHIADVERGASLVLFCTPRMPPVAH